MNDDDRKAADLANRSEALKQVLHQEGFRLTEQRRKILAVIRQTADEQHLSAEDIYQALSEAGEKIGISTIYRALHMLVSVGLVRELTLSKGGKRYELCNAAMASHHHIVCVQCGAVEAFDNAVITSLGTEAALQQGYSLIDCECTLRGICPRCLSRHNSQP